MMTFNSALRVAGALLAILISSSSFATLYPKEIKFQHMLENRDIVVGEVRAILQDGQGFMWFGGWNSLVRYDGYSFKNIYLSTIENGKEKLIPSSNQTFLFESSDKSIWVDAVKQYLLESGGEIFVNVLDENPYYKEFVQFETIITLPPAFYMQLKNAS